MFRRGLFYAYLSIYLRHFLGLSVTETTLFATLPMVSNILSQTFIWGKISDKFQLRRTLIIAGELVAGFGTVVVWYLHRLPETRETAGYVIILGLTVIEVFWAMSNISWSALVSDIYEAEERSGIQGKLASMGGIGRMAGVWMGGLLYDGLGVQYPGWGFYKGFLFFIPAGIMFISTIPMLFLPEGGVKIKSPEKLVPAVESEHETASIKIYWMFLLAMLFINFGRNSIAIIFPQYLSLANGLALESKTISYIINLQSVAIILFGWASGRIGQASGNANALLVGTATSFIALVVLTGFTQMHAVCVSSFLRGMGDVIILSTSYSLASFLIPPELRGRRFAWFNATFFLSWGLAGTIFAGPIVDLMIASGHPERMAYRMSFASAALITLIGLVIMYSVISYQKKRQLDLH